MVTHHTRYPRPKTFLWQWIVLPFVVLVVVASFETEDITTNTRNQAPDTAEIKKLFDTSSTRLRGERTSPRRLVDALNQFKGKHGRSLEDGLFCANPAWTQIGNEIDTDDSNFWKSISVDLSADGNIMAIGAVYSEFASSGGIVKVFRRNDSSSSGWDQIGQDLFGETSTDRFGQFVALSDDGNILAVGAEDNDGGGTDSGHVRVFERDPSSPLGWSQIGQDINGEAAGDNFGRSLDLSGNGDVVAIGAPYNDSNGGSSGHVRVYERNLSSSAGWVQVGGDLDGECGGDLSGYENVALSNSGDIVAIGAPFNDGNGQSSGHVRVYERDPSTALGWAQVGGDIDGEGPSELFGASVALSDDGGVVAIGGPWKDTPSGSFDAGYVKVYGRDSSSTLGWTQIGGSIYGDGGFDDIGYEVHLSSNGQVLAVGGDACFGGSYVKVYQRDPSSTLGWTQVGDTFFIPDDLYYPALFSMSVSLSSNGEVISIGAPKRCGGLYDSTAYVEVFEACEQPPPPTPTPTSSPTYAYPPGPPCSSGDDKFLFQMKTDGKGEDISWKVQVKRDGAFEDYFASTRVYGDNRVFQEKFCIPDDECYRFVILDSAGDGLCCDNGGGGYRLTWNNEIIKVSQFKDKEFEFYKFNCA